MDYRESPIMQFLAQQGKKLSKKQVLQKAFDTLNLFPLSKTQCIYVQNYKQKRITYCKGTLEFLGYTPEEFTTELIHTYIHPDDIDVVHRLIKAAVAYATSKSVLDFGHIFIAFRLIKKDGTYTKVLRQSNIFETDKNGRFISNVSLLTDISFMNTSECVEWQFKAKDLDEQEFKKFVQQQYFDFFSTRELQIIVGLKNGLKSEEISKELNISRNTVDTHRRNILKKSKCKSTMQLINFCKQHGIA